MFSLLQQKNVDDRMDGTEKGGERGGGWFY